MYVFLCEDSPEGIFTGVYDAWESRLGHNNISLQIHTGEENYDLFCTYRDVTPDLQKSEKVSRTLKQCLGEEVYSILYQAVISDEKCVSKRHPMDKADAVYKSIVLGLAIPMEAVYRIT